MAFAPRLLRLVSLKKNPLRKDEVADLATMRLRGNADRS